MRNERLAEKLRGLVRGRVLDHDEALLQYSRDRSIYEIQPRLVVLPEDAEDIQRVVAFAKSEGISLTARGGGSGLAGSALGEGIVMALPDNAFWQRIGDYSADGRTATVAAGAGVHHNDLQTYLGERGFFLPADVTSAEISRIGGNVATRASGPHALKYGSIDRFLESLEFVTSSGELVNTADERAIPARLKDALFDLSQRIVSDASARGALESRKGLKTASGYNLSAFLGSLPPGPLIAQLLCGSVGTLGLITRAVLRAEVHEREQAAILLSFDSLVETGTAVMALRELDVAAIELMSRETIQVIRTRAALPAQLAAGAHVLFVEVTGPDLEHRVNHVVHVFHHAGIRMSAAPVIVTAQEDVENLWKLRRRILWLIEHPEPGFRALAAVNDVGVPVEELAVFVHEVQQVLARQGMPAIVYGHAGNGNLHLRPLFDLSLPDLPGRIRGLADAVYEVVFRHRGTMTAEHGMGRLRAPYLKQEWGEVLYGYMREVKRIFDPGDLLNPGVMFSDRPITEHLREDLLKP